MLVRGMADKFTTEFRKAARAAAHQMWGQRKPPRVPMRTAAMESLAALSQRRIELVIELKVIDRLLAEQIG